jgi:hypothetical protein
LRSVLSHSARHGDTTAESRKPEKKEGDKCDLESRRDEEPNNETCVPSWSQHSKRAKTMQYQAEAEKKRKKKRKRKRKKKKKKKKEAAEG